MVKEKKPPEKPPEPSQGTAEGSRPKPVEPPKVVEAPKPQPPRRPSRRPWSRRRRRRCRRFEFDGGKTVDTSTDPVQLYKGYLEYTLRSKWNRPDNMDDDNYVAEVAVNVDKQGNISEPKWLKGSGNAQWDRLGQGRVQGGAKH